MVEESTAVVKCAATPGWLGRRSFKTAALGLSVVVCYCQSSVAALAACTVSLAPNSLVCGPFTSTTDTVNAIVAGVTTSRSQQFSAGGDVTAIVQTGGLIAAWGVGGSGLAIGTSEVGAGIAVTNNSFVRIDSGNSPSSGGTAALNLNTNGGNISYAGAGNILNLGTRGDGLSAAVSGTGNGGISITAGGTVLGQRNAIDAVNNIVGGTGGLRITANSQLAANNIGIHALTSSNGDLSITANANIAGVGGGSLANGILATVNFNSLAATMVNVNNATITTTDNAIDINNANFNSNAGITVNLNNSNVNGGTVGGLAAMRITNNGDGDVSINGIGSGTISSIVGEGIHTENFGLGKTTVDVAQDVSGTTGIDLAGLNDIQVSVGGNISATDGVGIIAVLGISESNATSGNIDVTQAAGKTIVARQVSDGVGDGISTDSGTSPGQTTVNVNGTINADHIGVVSQSSTGDITLNVSTTGKIDPLIGSDQTTVSGALTVNNAGLIQGDQIGVRQTSTGIGAVGDLTVTQTGTGSISISAGGGGTQAVVMNSVDANLVVTGNGNSTVIDATNGTYGIDATTTGTGNISISDNKITSGSADAIRATTQGAGNISVLGTGDITGGQLGINAIANGTGNINVNRIGSITGATTGISALSNNAGTINISGTGAVLGSSGFGILATSTADGPNRGDVTVAPASTVTGGTQDGIYALGNNVTVTTVGDVKGFAYGIQADGIGTVSVSTGAAVTGTNVGFGISATSTDGAINITSNGAVSGVGAGVSGFASNGGSVTIKANSDATSSTGNAIQAQTSGAISINQGASSTAKGLAGIVTKALGAGPTTITTNGTVIGTSAAGIGVTTTTAGPVSITNLGTVTGATDAISATVAGGVFGVVNSGTLNGSVVVLNADPVLSSFINFGTWNNGARNSAFVGTVTNSGMINVSDGVAGDTTVSVLGNYVGSGGTLKLDTFLGGAGSASDLFYVSGNSSGTTKLAINDTNIGLGSFSTVGIPVVRVDGTASTSNFSLISGPIIKGLFAYDLQYGGGQFYLASAPSVAAFSPLALVPSLDGVWGAATDATLAHIVAVDDSLISGPVISAVSDPPLAERPGSAVWMQGFGTWNHRGAATASAYDQSIYGAMMGVDFGANAGAKGRVIYGVTAAYLGSGSNIADGTGSNVSANGAAFSAHASYMQGGFFATGIAEATLMNTNMTISGFSASPGTRTIGGRAEMGYRFGRRWGYFFEPLVDFTATNTSIDSFRLAGTTYQGSGSDMRVGAGARYGISASDLSLAVTTRLWGSLQSGNSFTVTPVGPAFTISDGGLFPGVSVEFAAKASYNISPRANLFVDGRVESNGPSVSLAAKSGLSLLW